MAKQDTKASSFKGRYPYTHYYIYMVQKGPDWPLPGGGPPVFCKVFEEKVSVPWNERKWKHKLFEWLHRLKQDVYYNLWLSQRYWHTKYTIESEGFSSIKDFLTRHPEYKPFLDKKYLTQS